VLGGAPIARKSNPPLAVLADMQDAIVRRVGQHVAGRRSSQPLLDRGVARREADVLDLDLHLSGRPVLEARREGGFNGGPAAEDRAVVAFVFALFGPEGGDGLGVAFLESGGEVA